MHLVLYKFGFKVIGPMEGASLTNAENFFKKRGFKVMRANTPPSERTLRRWEQTNRGKAIDGCWVNGLCSCHHGARAWLAVFKEPMRD